MVKTKKIVKKAKPKKKSMVKTKKIVKKAKPKKVGVVENYLARIKVAVIKLTGTLNKGDKIIIQNTSKTREVKQTASSIQIDGKPVLKAGKGKSIGLKINKRVGKKNIVYKI